MTRLNHRKKTMYFPIIVERDGYSCFFCKGKFSSTHPLKFEHLNNNRNDSRLENLAFCHHECNIKKISNTDWQIKAHKKLLENEVALLASERKLADTGSTEELTSSQSISKNLRPIARAWVEEHTLMDKEVPLKDAVSAIVNLCQERIGWGSKPTIYRYIDEWCNPYNGKFTLSTNEQGKTIIRRRTEN